MAPVDTSAAPPGTDRRKFRQVHYQEARLAAACAQGSATIHYAATLHDVTDTGLRWAQCVRPGLVVRMRLADEDPRRRISR